MIIIPFIWAGVVGFVGYVLTVGLLSAPWWIGLIAAGAGVLTTLDSFDAIRK